MRSKNQIQKKYLWDDPGVNESVFGGRVGESHDDKSAPVYSSIEKL